MHLMGLRSYFRKKNRAKPVALGSLVVAMLPAELERYRAALRGAVAVIEYGSGGSTLLALREGARVVTVETDPDWLNNLRADPEITQAEAEGRLKLLHADIGPVHNYGRPKDASGRERYPLYAQLPWAHCETPDVVLIDGRFRVSAALESLPRCNAASSIVMHDFWNRPHYQPVLEFADVVDRVESLAVLKRKPVYDEERLRSFAATYCYDPE